MAALWDLNCSDLETRYFQANQESLAGCQSLIRAADHWHEDTTREASVAAAEGEATSFKRRSVYESTWTSCCTTKSPRAALAFRR